MVTKADFENLFLGVYKNRRIFVTGHSGFKGSWLALWLTKMGAIVKGYSLPPNTIPSHWDLLKLDIESIYADIRNREKLEHEIAIFKPEIVFHLAAQPLVRLSYSEPVDTFETNILGTINIFEAARKTKSVQAIINVTSDKCYENKEWIWGYRENDPMGGFDPYSASKGCSELITASYRNSFFNLLEYKKTQNVLLASARAGNVIGGGDWAQDRLVPDIMKAANENKKINIRNPYASRPWQHVLEPLSGYLHLGWKLLEGKKEFAEAWNFGPQNESHCTVGEITNSIDELWNKVNIEFNHDIKEPHEAKLLKLDCSKAFNNLKWKPVWNNLSTFKRTVDWYRNYYEEKTINSEIDLINYINDAGNQKIEWTK